LESIQIYIVSTLGIELSKEGTYSILLTDETNVTLKKMFTKLSGLDFHVTKHILVKLSDAIVHVHSKQVVHDGIFPENVCLEFNSFLYEPVLVGFSCENVSVSLDHLHFISKNDSRRWYIYQLMFGKVLLHLQYLQICILFNES
jgi:serine/threonine protein kinase